MKKIITLQIKYVENQSTFIPDEIREKSCAGSVIERLGYLLMENKIPKDKGKFLHGYEVEYNLIIDKRE